MSASNKNVQRFGVVQQRTNRSKEAREQQGRYSFDKDLDKGRHREVGATAAGGQELAAHW